MDQFTANNVAEVQDWEAIFAYLKVPRDHQDRVAARARDYGVEVR